MKLSLVLLITLIVSLNLSLFAQELKQDIGYIPLSDSTKYSYPKLHLSVSNFTCGSVGLGITKQTSKKCNEYVICAYKGVGLFGSSSGLYYQFNHFKKPAPSGFFIMTQLGVMKYKAVFFSLSTENNDEKANEGFAPIAAIGFGFSANMYKTSCIRVSLDGGCKLSPINLSITIVF